MIANSVKELYYFTIGMTIELAMKDVNSPKIIAF
jgi:hypothetical protein